MKSEKWPEVPIEIPPVKHPNTLPPGGPPVKIPEPTRETPPMPGTEIPPITPVEEPMIPPPKVPIRRAPDIPDE